MKIEEHLKKSIETGARIQHLESTISQHPSCAVLYAKKVLGGRFVLAEETIANSPYYVCAYLSELKLEVVPEVIHRSMLSKGIENNVDKNYWLKQYFKFCDYLEGKEPKPFWLKSDSVNWNYGDAFSSNF